MSDDKSELDLTAIEARYKNGIDIFEFGHLTSGDQENIVQADKDLAALIAEVYRLRERDELSGRPAPSVASQLGVMLMVEQVEAGKTIEIPSLGIKLTKDNLREREDEL